MSGDRYNRHNSSARRSPSAAMTERLEKRMALCRVATFPPSPGSCMMKRIRSAHDARVTLDGVYRFRRFRVWLDPVRCPVFLQSCAAWLWKQARTGCSQPLFRLSDVLPEYSFSSRILRLRSTVVESFRPQSQSVGRLRESIVEGSGAGMCLTKFVPASGSDQLRTRTDARSS